MQMKESEGHAGLWFLNSLVRVALSSRDNADGISLLEHKLPSGDASPYHVHEFEDELFYLIEGEMQFQVGEQRFTARAGDAFVAPHGQPHGFAVTSPEGARLLTISRGGFERMVRTASRPADMAVLPPAVEPSLAMQQDLAAICADNGITILGPPLPLHA